MHYHLEIVMPPTDDVEEAVKLVLAPFDENLNRDDEEASSRPFWDWWVIGGRWSGARILSAVGDLDPFYAELNKRGVRVSAFSAGKQTLQPASQAALVDKLWNEFFPEAPIKVCPIFDNYKGAWGDVLPLAELPPEHTCNHLIVAGPNYNNNLAAFYMVEKQIWNGVNYVDTTWDGKVLSGLALANVDNQHAMESYRKKRTPKPDWLVVTVDYHS